MLTWPLMGYKASFIPVGMGMVVRREGLIEVMLGELRLEGDSLFRVHDADVDSEVGCFHQRFGPKYGGKERNFTCFVKEINYIIFVCQDLYVRFIKTDDDFYNEAIC